MMFKRNLVSVSIASVLLTSSLVASANTGTSEEEDSVGSWGQWAQNYATAAGGEFNLGALAFAALAQSETGRNAQNEAGFDVPVNPVNPVVDPIDPVIDPVTGPSCSAGAFCGFATINTGGMMPAVREGGARNTDVGIVNAQLQIVDVQPGADRARALDGRYIPIVGSFGVEGNEGYELSVDGAEGSINRGGFNLHKRTDSGSQDLNLYYQRHAGVSGGSWYDETYGEMSSPTEKGFYSSTGGAVFGGVTTSLDQLNSYIGKHGVTASYIGSTLDNARVAVNLDFGTNTWGATVGAGRDFNGKTGFSVAGGKIDGINFSASSKNLSATDGAVKGNVNGAIFGSHAQGVAGMIDVVKTTDEYTDKEYETIFSGTNTKLMKPVPR
jgi:hypothetical protein